MEAVKPKFFRRPSFSPGRRKDLGPTDLGGKGQDGTERWHNFRRRENALVFESDEAGIGEDFRVRLSSMPRCARITLNRLLAVVGVFFLISHGFDAQGRKVKETLGSGAQATDFVYGSSAF